MPMVALERICTTSGCLSTGQHRWGGICTACHLDRKERPMTRPEHSQAFTVRPPDLPHAACQGLPLETFFPKKREDAEHGKRVCFTCPVVSDCLRHALAHEDSGTWGGMSEWERGEHKRREALQKRRAREARRRASA